MRPKWGDLLTEIEIWVNSLSITSRIQYWWYKQQPWAVIVVTLFTIINTVSGGSRISQTEGVTRRERCANLLDLEGVHVPCLTGSVNSMRSSCDCGHIEDNRKTTSTGERTEHLGHGRDSVAILATRKSAGVALRGESEELPEVQNNGISDPKTV